MDLARRPAAFSAVLLTAGAMGAGVALAASGDQDPSFNNGAPAVVDFPSSSYDQVLDLAVGPTHAISLLGRPRLLARAYVSGGQVELGRVGSDGTPFDVFGDHGFKSDTIDDMRNTGPRVVAVDRDDNTLVGYSSGDEPGPVDTYAKGGAAWGGAAEVDGDFTVARYLPTGTRDGIARVPLTGANDASVVDVVPQADGSTLVAGFVVVGEGTVARSVVVRLEPDGTRDLGYGTDGEAAIPGAALIGAGSQPGGPAGSIVTIAGVGHDDETGGFEQVIVRRFLADGSEDPTYGGTFDAPLPGDNYDLKAFVGRDGRAYVLNPYTAQAVRFGADGKPDAAYGTGGVLDLGADVALEGWRDTGADAQADGKLLVTGFEPGLEGKANAIPAVVARFAADGSGLDPEFADAGLFRLPLPDDSGDDAYANQLVVQDDGKIVVGGAFDRAYESSTDQLRALEPGEGQAFVLRLGTSGTVTTPTDTTPTDTTPTTPTTTTTTTPQATTPTATAPAAAPVAAQSKPAPKACASRRSFSIRLRIPKGSKPLTAVVKVNGKKVKTLRGKRITAPVDLRGLAKGRFTVSITVKLSNGKALHGSRQYRTCTPKSAEQTIPVL